MAFIAVKNSADIRNSQYRRYWKPSDGIGTLYGMAADPSKTSKMSPADVAAGKRLREIWNRKHRELGLTQQKAGEIMGMTQGAVGHYLNKRSAIGLAALLRFSDLLRCDPKAIRDDLPGLDLAMSQSVRGEAGKISSRREALQLSIQDVYERLQMHVWPAGYKPPTLETVGAWFSGKERPYDMHYLRALYDVLDMEVDAAITSGPLEARTALSMALLARIESLSVEEQERWLAFTGGSKRDD